MSQSKPVQNMAAAALPAAGKAGFIGKIKELILRLIRYVTTAKNWKSPKLWILTYLVLRWILCFLREYGLTIRKKTLAKEHVFLTGAGSGIGRLMALKLGPMGAKLTISDINLQGVQETRQMLLKKGVPDANITVIHLDVSKR